MTTADSHSADYRVLLVEDDFHDEESVRRTVGLADTSYTLNTARCLQDAVTMLRQHSYHAVLLDLSLPDSLGFETVQELLDEFRGVPIIVLSGVEDELLAARALKLGVQAYLVKGDATGGMVAEALAEAVLSATAV